MECGDVTTAGLYLGQGGWRGLLTAKRVLHLAGSKGGRGRKHETLHPW